jgi:hypothetical protein
MGARRERVFFGEDDTALSRSPGEPMPAWRSFAHCSMPNDVNLILARHRTEALGRALGERRGR